MQLISSDILLHFYTGLEEVDFDHKGYQCSLLLSNKNKKNKIKSTIRNQKSEIRMMLKEEINLHLELT